MSESETIRVEIEGQDPPLHPFPHGHPQLTRRR